MGMRHAGFARRNASHSARRDVWPHLRAAIYGHICPPQSMTTFVGLDALKIVGLEALKIVGLEALKIVGLEAFKIVGLEAVSYTHLTLPTKRIV